MSAIDYDDAYARSMDEPPFSNSTEGYGWMENWCDRCVHDASYQRWEASDGKTKDQPEPCPLLTIAIFGRTPAEWLEQRDENGLYSIADQYHCVMFRDEDDGPGPEPQPVPDPPGQEQLLPREPYEGHRMFVQPQEVRVS